MQARYGPSMSETRSHSVRRRRRSIGIVLLWIAALFIGPTLVAQALESWLVPVGMPAEALFLLAVPVWLMQAAWWLIGVTAIVGLMLVIGTPGSIRPAVFGAVVLVTGVITVIGFHLDGALFPPWAPR